MIMTNQAAVEWTGPSDAGTRGRWGEEQAVEYFGGLGYVLVARNFRTRLGEIDAIFQKNDEVVFVEVKMRDGRQIAAPEEAVTPAQQRRLIKTALQFIKQRRLRKERFRFDVVIVNPEGLQHIENAFSSLRHYTF
jgi:putative endonuclease